MSIRIAAVCSRPLSVAEVAAFVKFHHFGCHARTINVAGQLTTVVWEGEFSVTSEQLAALVPAFLATLTELGKFL